MESVFDGILILFVNVNLMSRLLFLCSKPSALNAADHDKRCHKASNSMIDGFSVKLFCST
ncbi:hypothetical protein QWZ16_24255 [Vibrio ostreicida]|uniref:Uncharacterized protein n=1 Tax=Vibrio ostreicida TaxID=526588 RepID=A0ABT8C2W6_9VIBR|nr:hypothetical protein [Vibrio ostreicida]MDN3611795.1 hypothetical protein [Vibrio ostreicida]MDN3612670.1 hypothetical protein [Vibrio ostreicida]MDN3612698.1 hypothetical protein [Vibrio ostreicida]